VSEGQQRVQVLSSLITLQQTARNAENLTELAYIMAHDTHRLITYDQALVWRMSSRHSVKVISVSGVSNPDQNAAYMQWLAQLIPQLVKQKHNPSNNATIYPVTTHDLPPEWAEQWQQWRLHEALWCPFANQAGVPPEGGLLLFRQKAWSESEQVLLNVALDAYRHAWRCLQRNNNAWWRPLGKITTARGVRLLLLLVGIGSLFIPVHLSVLAPAEIVAQDPFIVAAPLDGVVEKIEVQPNQPVAKNQILFRLDTTTLTSRHQVALKTLEVAKADYRRATQQMFGNAPAQAQAEVRFLKARVEEQEAEVAYSQSLLERALIRAQTNGIAVFNDPDYWQGRPVQVGEKVMTIADADKVELQVWLAVADAVALEPDAKVKLFLNTDPNNPLDAELYRTAYVAEQRPDQTLAFRLRARMTDEAQSGTQPRVGLKGTAKLYGEQVPLGYYLLRRPYAAIRQYLGV
jgi:hypothetical protein